VGKETLKFESIFGSLPDFPSLRPQVKRERSQVALFFLCVVSPAISGHTRIFTGYWTDGFSKKYVNLTAVVLAFMEVFVLDLSNL
jgi:hypothetical protein